MITLTYLQKIGGYDHITIPHYYIFGLLASKDSKTTNVVLTTKVTSENLQVIKCNKSIDELREEIQHLQMYKGKMATNFALNVSMGDIVGFFALTNRMIRDRKFW